MTTLDIAPRFEVIQDEIRSSEAELAQMRAEMVLTAFDPANRYAMNGMSEEQVDAEITPWFQNEKSFAPITGSDDRAKDIQHTLIRDMARLPQTERVALFTRIGVLTGAGWDKKANSTLELAEDLTNNFNYNRTSQKLSRLAVLASENQL